MGDLVEVECPEGHKFNVPRYVLDKFETHACTECRKMTKVVEVQETKGA